MKGMGLRVPGITSRNTSESNVFRYASKMGDEVLTGSRTAIGACNFASRRTGNRSRLLSLRKRATAISSSRRHHLVVERAPLVARLESAALPPASRPLPLRLRQFPPPPPPPPLRTPTILLLPRPT